ncbi:MAG: transcription termination/antitermination NusG family protein [Prevotella sp.]|nr:transcription termination/antitermination NusG family protein [Prevotella sp.]
MEPHNVKQYWFVAIVTPNTEKKAIERMDDLVQYWKKQEILDETETITAYVPIQKKVRYRPGTRKRVEVEEVLTSCYIFIRCSKAIRYKIASEAKFILHFLMNSATKTESGSRDFARIPDEQMENFMRMVGDAENEVTIDPTRIHVGDRVRIKTGKLAGLEANICKEPDGRTLLALRVDFLGYAKMECPIANLELVKQ